MISTTLATQSTNQATTPKPTSRLLALYGQPPVIRTEYATRWNAEKVCQEVQCPNCARWYRKTHNAHCRYCCIDLVHVVPASCGDQEVA